ncbi:MAG: hypothetical protein ACXV3S_13185, partial [Kineosporiaceae bacterium]
PPADEDVTAADAADAATPDDAPQTVEGDEETAGFAGDAVDPHEEVDPNDDPYELTDPDELTHPDESVEPDETVDETRSLDWDRQSLPAVTSWPGQNPDPTWPPGVTLAEIRDDGYEFPAIRSRHESVVPRRPRTLTLVLVFLAVVLTFAGAALGYSMLRQQRLYGAEVDFNLTPRFDLSDAAVDRESQTQMLLVSNPSVLQPVARQFRTTVSALQAAVSTDMAGRSSIMEITVADPRADHALALAQAVAASYQRASAASGAGKVPNASTTTPPKPPPSASASRSSVPATPSPAPGGATNASGQPVGPAMTATLLNPARRLEQPLQPRPARALAAGGLVGVLVGAVVVLLLWRPWRFSRPVPYWT